MVNPSSVNTNIEKSTALQVFPNPTCGTIAIVLPLSECLPTDLRVYDVLGKEVFTLAHDERGQSKNPIILPLKLSDGEYIVRVQQNGGSVSSAKFFVAP